MSKINCPNCGAPYNPLLNKCPYCGTSYFDLTSIDFESNEPVWLKMNFLNRIITMKVIPKLESIVFSSETTYAYGGKHGEKLAPLTQRKNNLIFL